MLEYSLKRTTGPATEPVTLDEIKSHLRLSGNDEDARLENLLVAARQAVERDTGRSLITQTWTRTFDRWPSEYIELEYPPTIAVTTIKYVDSAGDQQTWASDEYVVDISSQPGLVTLAYSEDWPTIRGDRRGLEIVYTAGYGTAAEDIPCELRQAVLLRLEMEFDCPSPELQAAYRRLVESSESGAYP